MCVESVRSETLTRLGAIVFHIAIDFVSARIRIVCGRAIVSDGLEPESIRIPTGVDRRVSLHGGVDAELEGRGKDGIAKTVGEGILYESR